MVVYFSQFPVIDVDHVKATTNLGASYLPHLTCDHSLLLTGTWAGKQWVTDTNEVTNQRFHIDLGVTQIIKRIYYENAHSAGGLTTAGAKNFTFWGSNDADDFNELTYAEDGTWVQLTTSQSTFDEHAATDAADPKYIVVTNTTPYRYHAFKFADNYGHTECLGVRRIELQTVGQSLAGTIAKFSGAIARRLHTRRLLDGSLIIFGGVHIGTLHNVSGGLRMSGKVFVLTEILYYGPANP